MGAARLVPLLTSHGPAAVPTAVVHPQLVGHPGRRPARPGIGRVFVREVDLAPLELPAPLTYRLNPPPLPAPPGPSRHAVSAR